MEKALSSKERITLIGRESLEINGVVDICGFDEEGISMNMESDKLSVDGENLKIEGFEGGTVRISGNISSISFSSDKSIRRGFLGRLFG